MRSGPAGCAEIDAAARRGCTTTCRRRSTRPRPSPPPCWTRPGGRARPGGGRASTRPRPSGRTPTSTPRSCKRAVEREVAELRQKVAGEREAALNQLKASNDEANAKTAALLAESTEHHSESAARLEADIAEAARIRAEAARRGRGRQAGALRGGRGPDRHGQEAGRGHRRADPAGVRLAQAAAAPRDRAAAPAQAGRAQPAGQPVRPGRADCALVPGPGRPGRSRTTADRQSCDADSAGRRGRRRRSTRSRPGAGRGASRPGSRRRPGDRGRGVGDRSRSEAGEPAMSMMTTRWRSTATPPCWSPRATCPREPRTGSAAGQELADPQEHGQMSSDRPTGSSPSPMARSRSSAGAMTGKRSRSTPAVRRRS